MTGTSLDGVETYRSSFARRTAAMSDAGQVVSEPGICGALATQQRGGRLLVTDDRAQPTLENLLAGQLVQIVTVFAEAARCHDLFEASGRWRGESVTAMICRDLTTLPSLPLAPGLTIRPVRRVSADPIDGVPLEDAAQACLAASPDAADQRLPDFIAYLQSLTTTTRLLAAVDDHNTVRATAGASAVGPDASAYFVSTDQQWRRQGVGAAMTAAALSWARAAGARMACLDATAAGLSIYLRLGFEAVGPAMLYHRLS